MMADGNVIPLWRAQLQQGERGVKNNLTNLVLYLRNLPGLGTQFRYNELTCNVEWKGRPVEDIDYVDVRLIVESAGYKPEKSDIAPSVARIAHDNSYHPVRDYLDGLTWDNKPRVDKWLHRLMGTADGAYEATVGAKWLIGAVARVYEPGCKMDNMLVLEGPQDIGKSTALMNLFGHRYFTEMTMDLRDQKRFVEQIMGKWVVEFAELATLRKSDMEMTKAVITTQIDRTTRNYAHNASEHPRQCVLAATVNPRQDSGYLSDPTGNRRFWPVFCTKVEMDLIKSNRDQLWAEAVHRYRAGEQWWLTGDDKAAAHSEQAQRVFVDPWADVLEAKLNVDWPYTSAEILKSELGVPVERQSHADKIRVAAVMTQIGWVQKVGKTTDGKSVKIWRKPVA